MSVLVDSSIWIDYFRGIDSSEELDFLIEEDLVVVNDLILTELIPPLYLKRQRRLISLLEEVKRADITTDWSDLRKMQITCLQAGINAVGIPDLIIAQNAIQNSLRLLTKDKHFSLLCQHMPLSLYGD